MDLHMYIEVFWRYVFFYRQFKNTIESSFNRRQHMYIESNKLPTLNWVLKDLKKLSDSLHFF